MALISNDNDSCCIDSPFSLCQRVDSVIELDKRSDALFRMHVEHGPLSENRAWVSARSRLG